MLPGRPIASESKPGPRGHGDAASLIMVLPFPRPLFTALPDVCFKCYGYMAMSQALDLIVDLKLGE